MKTRDVATSDGATSDRAISDRAISDRADSDAAAVSSGAPVVASPVGAAPVGAAADGSATPASVRELERHEFVGADDRHLFVYGDLRGRLDSTHAPVPAGTEPIGLHKRFDSLTATWIAVSPARNVRPHSGPAGATDEEGTPCPLCPGGPEVPFSYDAAVFDNRFPALVADPPPVSDDPRVGPAQGHCEVVLYTEHHEGSLATLTPTELARVVAVWRDRSGELWTDARN